MRGFRARNPVNGAFACAVAIVATPTTVAAQEPGVVAGTVVTGELAAAPIAGAAVTIRGLDLATITDSAGRFFLTPVPVGSHEVVVHLIGWSTTRVRVSVPLDDPLLIRLEPNPVMLDPIMVTAADILRQRREAAQQTARAFGRAELAAAGNFMVEALRSHGVNITDCPDRTFRCVYVRGAVARPAVCINDMPAMDGLAELARYPAETLELVEVYGAGRMIRAYTREYMERIRTGDAFLAAIDMNLRRC